MLMFYAPRGILATIAQSRIFGCADKWSARSARSRNRYRLRWREAVRDPSCRSRCSLRQDDTEKVGAGVANDSELHKINERPRKGRPSEIASHRDAGTTCRGFLCGAFCAAATLPDAGRSFSFALVYGCGGFAVSRLPSLVLLTWIIIRWRRGRVVCLASQCMRWRERDGAYRHHFRCCLSF